MVPLRYTVIVAAVILATVSAADEKTITCVVESEKEIICNGTRFEEFKAELLPVGSGQFYLFAALSLTLVLLAGIFSGLTLGLLSFDTMQLKVLCEAGKEKERNYARKITPLVERHHMLLVTLLLANAAVAETLPLFLDRLVPEVYAIVISVTAVLMFGEVIPQAICARYGLAIGAFFTPFVWLLMIVTSPISYPLGLLLDKLLGHHHSAFFRRAELGVFLDLHQSMDEDNEEPLREEELKVLKGALDMRDKTVEQVMTTIKNVLMFSYDDVLDAETMDKILAVGHSRIPIYDKDPCKAERYILVKSLIKYDPVKKVPLRDIKKRKMLTVEANTPLFDMLHKFSEGESHIARIVDDSNCIIGILTLEDVIEELIQEEIVDETDVFVDVERQLRVVNKFRDQLHTQLSLSYDNGTPLRSRDATALMIGRSASNQPSYGVSPPRRVLRRERTINGVTFDSEQAPLLTSGFDPS